MSDNRYYVKLVVKLSFALALGAQQSRKLLAKLLQCLEPLRRGLDHLALRLKDLAPFLFGEHAHDFAHAPAGRAQDLQAAHARHQQGDTVDAYHSNALRKAFERMQFTSRKVHTLKLFGGSRHGRTLVPFRIRVARSRDTAR